MARSLVWVRGKDLRLSDHEPLARALLSGETLSVFIVDPYFFHPSRALAWPNRMRYLLQALLELRAAYAKRGGELVLLRGHSVRKIPELCERLQVDQLLAYRWTEPLGQKRDEKVRAAVRCPFLLYEGETLMPPGSIQNQAGQHYQVFTPFYRKFREFSEILPPIDAPLKLPSRPTWARFSAEEEVSEAELRQLLATLEERSAELSPLGVKSRIITAGERAAEGRLRSFEAAALNAYPKERDFLGAGGTSRLSQDLKFGTISARSVWHRLAQHDASETFLRQLVWREFAYHSAHANPDALRGPVLKKFIGFPYLNRESDFQAWVEGRTGYPIVDAAQRQLLLEGYVDNRARMVSASFAVKHLLLDYRLCERHYLKYLTDGDLCLNNLGWQWSAGCGYDAQPYFRIFNPSSQAAKFDPQGVYQRTYLSQGNSPQGPLFDAPGSPLVEHRAARERYLECARQHFAQGL